MATYSWLQFHIRMELRITFIDLSSEFTQGKNLVKVKTAGVVLTASPTDCD